MIVFLTALPISNTRADLPADLKNAEATLKTGDYETAYREFNRVAREQNDPLAQFNLALFHQLGWGRPVDPVKACQWFEKAAEGGIPAAQKAVADCFELGIHRPADPLEAAAWYRKAVDSGHLTSYCHLARFYMTGQGVPKDPQKGLELCRRAAQQGGLPAQRMMGMFLLEGDPGIRNPEAAIQWFSLAAQRNDPAAQYQLGAMLRDGVGTTRNDATALTWFESAAAQGFARAYFPTAKAYFDVYSKLATVQEKDAALAKAYMWLNATEKQTGDPTEKRHANAMLEQVLEDMPTAWAHDLDHKVDAHLAKFNTNSDAGG